MPSEAEFLMYLCSGDSVLTKDANRESLYIFKGVHATQFTAKFVHHNDARKDNEKDPKTGKAVSIQVTCVPNSFENKFPQCRKVEILAEGSIRDCN